MGWTYNTGNGGCWGQNFSNGPRRPTRWGAGVDLVEAAGSWWMQSAFKLGYWRFMGKAYGWHNDDDDANVITPMVKNVMVMHLQQ